MMYKIERFLVLLIVHLLISGGQAQTLDDDDVPPPSRKATFAVEEVATGLEVPWAMAFASDERLLVTERPGRVRVIENGKLRDKPLFILDDVKLASEAGLMGLAIHPDYKNNRWIYIAYVYENKKKKYVKVVRFVDNGSSLTAPKTIIEGIRAAKFHAGTGLGFGPSDGKLYITTGDATKQKLAQKLNSLNGKTLRLNDDGSIPTDNPFVGQKNARSEIWSYGHRNAQGMTWSPEGLMFQTEHGPSFIDGVSLFKKRTGGDEINIVERGRNYGWAKISHKMTRAGMVSPLVEYSPAVAPASAIFYTGKAFREYQGNLFFCALKGKSIIRVVLEGRRVAAQEVLLKNKYGRLRAIAEGPDGAIYFSTSNHDSRGKRKDGDDRILRLVPEKK